MGFGGSTAIGTVLFFQEKKTVIVYHLNADSCDKHTISTFTVLNTNHLLIISLQRNVNDELDLDKDVLELISMFQNLKEYLATVADQYSILSLYVNLFNFMLFQCGSCFHPLLSINAF